MTQLADAVRRAVDLVAAVVGLVVTSPLLLGAALAIRVRLGRGVLFRQQRVGRGGHPFVLLKFRTMRHPTPGRTGPEHDAERLTRLGSWLRATSIDELPSLVNLLRGDITLVGPRPLPVHYWNRYRGDEYRRFEVKPGITGLAQINGRNTVGWPERLAFDVEYVATRSLRGDLKILLRTVPVVLGRTGVDQEGGVTMHELPGDRPTGTPPTSGR
jgi:lipopolysaccharide/colanic/teichoic acid biosynthesis glycosyltransferase